MGYSLSKLLFLLWLIKIIDVFIKPKSIYNKRFRNFNFLSCIEYGTAARQPWSSSSVIMLARSCTRTRSQLYFHIYVWNFHFVHFTFAKKNAICFNFSAQLFVYVSNYVLYVISPLKRLNTKWMSNWSVARWVKEGKGCRKYAAGIEIAQ